MREVIIGLDVTTDANVPRAVCTDCMPRYEGSPIYAGDEWAGACICIACGDALPVTREKGTVVIGWFGPLRATKKEKERKRL